MIVLALRRAGIGDAGDRRPRRRRGCSACSRETAAGARSTSTTRAGSLRSSRSATSARSPTRRAPTSPRTCVEALALRRAAPTSAAGAARRRVAAARAGATTARGSAAGARTTSTAPAPPCPRSPPAGSREHESVRRGGARGSSRVQNADGGFGEDLRSYRDRRLARARRVDRVADGLGAARAPRGRRERRPVVDRAVDWLVETQLRGRRAGTSRTSPAPASPATSTSTTTSTGMCSR